MYMSNAIVKKDVTPGIDQSFVANMDRGEFAMPYRDKDHFKLPKLMDTLNWIPEGLGREFRLQWTSNPPNLLESSEKSVSKSEKAEIAKKICEESDVTQSEAAEALGVSQSLIAQA